MQNLCNALRRLNSRKISESTMNLEEVLGRGSYGKVVKAIWEGREVAVKIFLPRENNEQNDQKLINEIKQMTKVFHPNIVRLFGYSYVTDDCGQHFALVMEKVDGGSLDKILYEKLDIRYSLWHIFWWLFQCARGVSYMHSMKERLIHRDIKSPNLLLSNDGVIKIADFGTVRVIRSVMTDNRGSIPWMAPEVFSSHRYTDKVDVYSIGVLLWELMARKIPWMHLKLHPFAILYNVAEKKIRLPLFVDCPKRIEDLMTKCWAHNPEDRPSMKEVELSCQRILSLCTQPINKDIMLNVNNQSDNIEEQKELTVSFVQSAIEGLNVLSKTNGSLNTDYLNNPIASTGYLSQDFRQFKAEESKLKPVRRANGFKQSEQLYEDHQDQLRTYRKLKLEEFVLSSDPWEQGLPNLQDFDKEKMKQIEKSLKEEQTTLTKLKEQLEIQSNLIQSSIEIDEFVMVPIEMVNPSRVINQNNHII